MDFVSKTNPFGRPKPKKSNNPKIQEQRAIFQRMKMDARDRFRPKQVDANGE